MKRFLFLSLMIGATTFAYSQISFYYDADKDTLLKKDNYYESNSELWIGVVNEGIQIFRIAQNDTFLIFKSFGCTQYNDDVLNSVILYVWGRYFYESDCLCAGDDEMPCRPDTTNADLKLLFTFNNGTTKVSISKIPFIKSNSFSQKVLDSIKEMETIHFVRLNRINSIFRKRHYHKSLEVTQFLLDNYYDFFFLSDLDSRYKLSKVDFNIMQFIIEKGIEPDSFLLMNYQYHRSLLRYIKPLEGKTLIGNELKKLKIKSNTDNNL